MLKANEVRAGSARTAPYGVDKIGDLALHEHITKVRQADRRKRHAALALEQMPPVVYAVLTTDGFIKIGHTTDLNSRLRKYGIRRTDMSRLLMAVAGTAEDEAALHSRFAPYRARGLEYYRSSLPVLTFVNEQRERLGIPPLDFA